VWRDVQYEERDFDKPAAFTSVGSGCQWVAAGIPGCENWLISQCAATNAMKWNSTQTIRSFGEAKEWRSVSVSVYFDAKRTSLPSKRLMMGWANRFGGDFVWVDGNSSGFGILWPFSVLDPRTKDHKEVLLLLRWHNAIWVSRDGNR
jgi:hypothetical protein